MEKIVVEIFPRDMLPERYVEHIESNLMRWERDEMFDHWKYRVSDVANYDNHRRVRVVDISFDGTLKSFKLEAPDSSEYLPWMRDQRKLLEVFPANLKTRIVLAGCATNTILLDLFALPLAVEFSVFATSFFKEYHTAELSPLPHAPSTFLDLEYGHCVKVIHGGLTSAGLKHDVTTSEFAQ